MPFPGPVAAHLPWAWEVTPARYPLPQSWRWPRPGTNWMLFCSVCWRRVTWTGWDLAQHGVIGSRGPWVGPQRLA